MKKFIISITAIILLIANTFSKDTTKEQQEIYNLVYNYGHHKFYFDSLKTDNDYINLLSKYDPEILYPIIIECLESDTFFIDVKRGLNNQSHIDTTRLSRFNVGSGESRKSHIRKILCTPNAVNTKFVFDYLFDNLYKLNHNDQQMVLRSLGRCKGDLIPEAINVLTQFIDRNCYNDDKLVKSRVNVALRALTRHSKEAALQYQIIKKFFIESSTHFEAKLKAGSILYDISTEKYLTLIDSLQNDIDQSIFFLIINNNVSKNRKYQDFCNDSVQFNLINNFALNTLSNNPNMINQVISLFKQIEYVCEKNKKDILSGWVKLIQDTMVKVPDSLHQKIDKDLLFFNAKIDSL